MSVLRASITMFLLVPALLGQTRVPLPAERSAAINFAAIDATGAPVQGIEREQVAVLDDGQTARTVTVESISEQPLELGIIFFAERSGFQRQKEVAEEVIRRLVRPGKDRVFAVTAGGVTRWTNTLLWQSDSNEIARTISALDKDTGMADAFAYHIEVAMPGANSKAEALVPAVPNIAFESLTGREPGDVFDAALEMFRRASTAARRALVVFRLASRHAPGISERASQDIEDEHRRLIRRCQGLNVPLYVLQLDEPDPRTLSMQATIATEYHDSNAEPGATFFDDKLNRELERQYNGGIHNLQRLAQETGGGMYSSAKKYRSAVDGIAKQLTAEYRVTFIPASGPAKPHRIRLQVAGASRVAAPEAFVAP